MERYRYGIKALLIVTVLFSLGYREVSGQAGSPGEREGHAMAFHALSGKLVLFGGATSTTLCNDTWTWSGGSWVKETPRSAPAPRRDFGFCESGSDGTLLLFGGKDLGSNGLGDTWTWDGRDWKRLALTTSPSPRWGHSMAYDPDSKEVVLFGGYDSVTSQLLDDTWIWRNGDWSDARATNRPSPRIGHRLTFDPDAQEIMIFGGWDGKQYLGDTWIWGGFYGWTKSSATGPTARRDPVVFTQESFVVMFGGVNSTGTLDDTWTYRSGGWGSYSFGYIPTSRSTCAGAFDPVRRIGFIHGGRQSATSILSDFLGWIDNGPNTTWQSVKGRVLEVPTQYKTIQSAIDNAELLDVILVDPGKYIETVRYNTKRVILRSRDGARVTTIDAGGKEVAVRIDTRGKGVELCGFTVCNSSRDGMFLSCDGLVRDNIDSLVKTPRSTIEADFDDASR
jgi:Kelch motif protein